MKRLLFIAAMALIQRAGPDQALTSTIDGAVKHSGTAEFIPGVVVSLVPATGMPVTSTTDEKGRFSFKNVSPGSYRLQSQRDGYLRAAKGGGPQTLTVAAGQDIHDVSLGLIVSGTISGRIVDNMGQPLKGIQVSAVLVGYNNGREAPITAVGAENRPLTDDQGNYRLYGFSPGDYFVKAETPPSVGAAAPPRMVSYYPGALSAPEAAPVTLHEGSELNGINFKLQAPDPRPLHRISGKAILPAETVGSGIVGNLYLFPRDREAGADGNGYTVLSTNRAESMSNGNFVLRDVPPGRYDVIAALPSLSSQREYSRVEVVVGDKDVDGVTIPLSRKFDVQGRVVADNGAGSLALTSFRISLTRDFQLQNYSSSVDANGAFNFKDVAEGKYSVSIVAGLPASAYVADIRQNSKSIFAGIASPDEAVIDVNTQASSASSIEVVVNPVGGVVTVTVQDAKSRIVPEATVALVPEAPRRQTLMWFKTGVSDDHGKVSLSGVAPGAYKIFAWERTPLRAYQSADFLREYETQGKFVTVDFGGRVDATIGVIPDDGNRPPRTFKYGTLFTPAPADAVPTPAPTTTNPNYGTIEGRVTRLKTGDPIPGVPVYVGDQVARSGTDGRYIINDVPPGTYRLNMINAQRLGFFAPSQGGVPGSVTVKAKQHIYDLSFKLSAGGNLSGRVLDGKGQPVKAAPMQLEGPDYQYAKHYLIPALIISRTDDRGEYRMSGVEPGEYYLRVRLGSGGPLAMTYFPSANNLNKARVVVVREDDEIVGLDITAQPASGFKVSGRVLPPNGDAPASTSFYLVPADGAMADMLDMVVQPRRDRDTGDFEIANVMPGSYDLIALETSARTAGPRATPDSAFTARTRVDVGSQDVQGVTMTFAPAVDVQGRVVVDGDDKAIPPNSVHLYPVAEEFSPSATWLISPAPVDATGQFVIAKMLPLRYSFTAAGIPEDAYIADIREGTTSVFDTGLRVGNQPPDPIEVVINPKGATVDGVVYDSSQKGIAYTQVVLAPQVSRRGVSSFYKTAITDGAGHFTIRGIAPGDYKLFAWENDTHRAWRDPEFMAPFEERGSPVHIEPAANVENVAVRIISKSPADSH